MNNRKIVELFQNFHFEVEIFPIKLDLPIVFQRRYHFAKLSVNHRSFLLLKEQRVGSLNSFVNHAKAIQKQCGDEIILVFSKLSDEEKKKLLQIGMPYLDYHENAYLPQFGFLFSTSVQEEERKKPLSSTEQKVLLTLLLHCTQEEIGMEMVSQLTELSIPSLYRTFKQLKERGWLTNRQKSYTFAKSKRSILEEAKRVLKNPVKEIVMFSDADFRKFLKRTPFRVGHSQAVSYLGMLAISDDFGNYVLSKKQYREIRREVAQPIFQGHRIEIWDYAPIPFDYQVNGWEVWGGDDVLSIVDPISLYLTLREDTDPRIEEEAEELEKTIVYFLGEENAS